MKCPVFVGVRARSESSRGTERSADTVSRRLPALLAGLCFHPCCYLTDNRQSTDKLELICVISASALLNVLAF